MNQTFDESQFIASLMSEYFLTDTASDRFYSKIIENIKFFARKNKTDFISNTQRQFSSETRWLLRRCLVDQVLGFYVLKDKFKPKNRKVHAVQNCHHHYILFYFWISIFWDIRPQILVFIWLIIHFAASKNDQWIYLILHFLNQIKIKLWARRSY